MLNQAPEPLVLPMQELHLSVVGRYLGVPTSFFNVEIEGARYLARVKAPHKDHKDMLWMQFAQAGYGDEAFAPLSVVQKWLISDDEALDPKPASVNEATRGVEGARCFVPLVLICYNWFLCNVSTRFVFVFVWLALRGYSATAVLRYCDALCNRARSARIP